MEWAQLSFHSPIPFKKGKAKGVKYQGIKYEREVQGYLARDYPSQHVGNPWIKFKQAGIEKPRWCQPDALLVNMREGIVTIIEVKYSHTTDAWWQLRHLYEPVLRRMFDPRIWRFQVCEICKWQDPDIRIPEATTLVPRVGGFRSGSFGIHLWSAQRDRRRRIIEASKDVDQ